MKKWEKPMIQELDLSKTMYDMITASNGRLQLRCPSCCKTYRWHKGNYYCESDLSVIASGNGQTFYCEFSECPGKENGNRVLQSDLIQCS